VRGAPLVLVVVLVLVLARSAGVPPAWGGTQGPKGRRGEGEKGRSRE
jgi:hypothetical protein